MSLARNIIVDPADEKFRPFVGTVMPVLGLVRIKPAITGKSM